MARFRVSTIHEYHNFFDGLFLYGPCMNLAWCAAGRMQALYSDLPHGQEDDRWHQLMQGNARTSRGTLRLGALFKDLVILPVEEYNELKEVCVWSRADHAYTETSHDR